MKSLQSLCLLKVSSLGLNYEDIPKKLVKELNKMKVFNGNYITEFGGTVLTIQYDGVSWTFQSCTTGCSNNQSCDCCGQAHLHQFTVTEGETVPATSPFGRIRTYFH